jgi:hypothetical protein
MSLFKLFSDIKKECDSRIEEYVLQITTTEVFLKSYPSHNSILFVDNL